MNLVACVSRDWGIGKDGRLLFQIAGDMRRFQELTWGNYVIMGRKTLESLPKKAPLEGRGNIVLSRTMADDNPDITLCRDVEELLQVTREIAKKSLFVIGGGEIYKLLLPYCNKAYITWVDDAPPADTFLPRLDTLPGWREAESSQMMENKGYLFQFITYERKGE